MTSPHAVTKLLGLLRSRSTPRRIVSAATSPTASTSTFVVTTAMTATVVAPAPSSPTTFAVITAGTVALDLMKAVGRIGRGAHL